MSYDLRIAVKVEGTKDLYAVIAQPEYHSPTYNIGDMFRACTEWDFVQSEWYKVTDVYDKIVHGIEELQTHIMYYKKYDSPNGWGNTESAIHALESLKECIDGITGEIGFCTQAGWNQVPKEYLYVAW